MYINDYMDTFNVLTLHIPNKLCQICFKGSLMADEDSGVNKNLSTTLEYKLIVQLGVIPRLYS